MKNKTLLSLLFSGIFFVLSFAYVTPVEGSQLPIYTLEPSEKQIVMPVSGPNDGYGINALLKSNNELVLNQAGITYRWSVVDPSVLSINSSGFTTGCPYGIYSPCSNLHSDISAKKAGTTKILVDAYLYDQWIAATSFVVTVKPKIYTLEPSQAVITTQIHKINEGYGVNVKLLADGQLMIDQSNVWYEWSSSSPAISVYASGMNSGCPFGINSPCPELHADFRALKVGTSTISVAAYVNNQRVASTKITVIVEDLYSIEFLEATDVLESGIDYPFLVMMNRNNIAMPYIQDIKFEWQNSTGDLLWIRDHQLLTGCPQPMISPCSNISATVRGKRSGYGSIVVIAKTLDDVELARKKFPVTVVTSSQPTTVAPIAVVSPPIPVHVPEPVVGEPVVGERVDQLEQTIVSLQKQVEDQQAQLEAQGDDIKVQEEKVSRLEQLYNKIAAWFASWF